MIKQQFLFMLTDPLPDGFLIGLPLEREGGDPPVGG